MILTEDASACVIHAGTRNEEPSCERKVQMATAIMDLIGNDHRSLPGKADGMDRRPQSRVPDIRHHDVASDGGGEHWAISPR